MACLDNLMTSIQQITQFRSDDLLRLLTGYTSNSKYQAHRSESEQRITFALELVDLPTPYRRPPDPIDDEVLSHYRTVPQLGFSFEALEGSECVGIALAEPRAWNRSLWVWELHVAESHRQRGIGRQLVEAMASKSREANLRTLVCETQTTNMPAIRFYRRMGFELDGVDLSYYTNEDFPAGETAVFMKKRL